MNTISRSLGVRPQSPAQRLALLQRSCAHRVVPCGTLAIGDQLGFLFSSGVMYGFLASYYKAGAGTPRPSTAALVLLRAMASAAVDGPYARHMAQRFTATLTVDGTAVAQRENFLLLGAATVEQAGLGLRPFRRVAEDQSRFHFLAYTGSLKGLLQAIPLFAAGRGALVRNARDEVCRELSLAHAVPLPYALDGDLYKSPGPTTLRCGPLVRFLV